MPCATVQPARACRINGSFVWRWNKLSAGGNRGVAQKKAWKSRSSPGSGDALFTPGAARGAVSTSRRVVRYNVSQGIDMATTEMVHIRIDRRVKAQATKALASMGLSISDAVRVLLTRVAAEKALPFEVKVPNAVTVVAMREARKGGLPSFRGR